jgi:hypothetical protein
MEAVPVKIVPRDFGETRRRDWWWVEPMIVFAVFGSFVVYATWAAFQNAHYGAAAVLAGASDSAVPRALPLHVLLLPGRVLQGLLDGPGLVHGGRAAKELLG